MNIAILSNGNGNYTTKRLREEAINRGHQVRIIKYRECYALIEQNKPAVHYRGEVLPRFDAIIPRIGSSYTDYGSAIVRQFEMRGVFTTASSIAIVRSRDKLRSFQLLARAGVDIPKTIFARDIVKVEDLMDELGGAPLIIKMSRGTHGNGVILAETKKAAKSVIQALYVASGGGGSNVFMQEYVRESSGTDIRAFVVDGRVVASMKRKSLDEDFRSNIHQGGEGEKVVLSKEERKVVLSASKAMGLAICGVDFMRSDRGPLILEVNSSPGTAIEQITGRNVVAPIIDYVEKYALRGKKKKDRVGA